MSLAPGTRLGPYEITGQIGAGGMGEVYRARDTKLNRDVAIKVLLPSVASDPDRLARFSREAQLLGALNHPNIAHIHGLEDSTGVSALVMELVDGSTLADRLAHGPLPIDEALPIARQVADALEAAHEQGIIHRDLKPANIKVREDGTVKVLDFGLAKALEPPVASGPDATTSPTLSLNMTQAGVILGTAAYMSPEQARGRPVGPRTDVWAFGCVLFEMLTGERAFRGDDLTDTIVAIVSKEPDWTVLPPAAARVRPLIARCLKKDPKQRLQAIGDARIQIEEIIAGGADSLPQGGGTAAHRRPVMPALLAGTLLGAALMAVLIWTVMRPAPRDPPLSVRFGIVPGPGETLAIQGADRDIAISPDGKYIVYRAGPQPRLVVRALDRLETRVLEGSTNARAPFFSPDGQWVGFFDGAALKKVGITGGPPITICRTPIPRGASWGDDGYIVFATQDRDSGVLRVPASGGEPVVLTRPDPAKGESNHWYPSTLPSSRGVLFTITAPGRADRAQIAVYDANTRQIKALIRNGSHVRYVEPGYLVYGVGGTLSAMRFDLANLEVTGDPVVIVADVRTVEAGLTNSDISRGGTLIYVPGGGADAARSLVWVDRAGRQSPLNVPARRYQNPRLSPDGSRVVVAIRDGQDDIHVFDLKRGTFVRLAASSSIEARPIWAPDGKRVIFSSQRDEGGNLYIHAADGTGSIVQVTSGPNLKLPGWVAPDGSGVLGSEISQTTAGDIVWFPARVAGPPAAGVQDGSTRAAHRIVATPSIDYFPEVSPNGRYLAYMSNQSGRDEIYVKPFPSVQEGVWRVSEGGGTKPVWARNGRELYYIDPSGMLSAVPVETSASIFTFGNASPLFEVFSDGPYTPRDYDVAVDGRFLMARPPVVGERPAPGMIVVLNWFEDLKRLVPTK